MEYYGCYDEGVGCGATASANPGHPGGNFLIKDALKPRGEDRWNRGGPTSPAVGGTFDSVIVVHAGNGNETTRFTNGDIWSIFYADDASINDHTIRDAGAGFEEGDVVPETEASGISSPLSDVS